MKSHLRLRLTVVTILVLLSLLTTEYPIFRPWDLDSYENREIAFYYLEIQGKENGVYLAHAGFTQEEIYIRSPGDFSPGDIVSFRGEMRGGVLVNQEYHYHSYPTIIYPLSAVGFVVFLFLFLKKWRFSLKEMRFKEVED